MNETSNELQLRSRKKLRTHRELAEAALRLFTERGYDHTTLDELCDEVEVSKRTFFRYFRSKEDVALASDSELWTAYLDRMRETEPEEPLLETLHVALKTTLTSMPPNWEHRFLATRALSKGVPALEAQVLGFCQETTCSIAEMVVRQRGADRDDWLARLTVEVFASAWRTASLKWTEQNGRGGRKGLIRMTDETFACLPSILA
jgi:AcrR family transcriptional regulator